MSVSGVFWHDLLYVRRSRLGASVLLIHLFLVVLVFLFVASNAPARKTVAGLGGLMFANWIVIPATALLTSVLAISHEHESGTLRFLLGFPNGRRDIVLGKFLSRVVIVNVGLVVGFVLVQLVAVLIVDTPRPLSILQFMILTILFTTSYVGLGIGISAATTTHARAVAGAIFTYAIWTIFWLPGFPLSIPFYLGEFSTRAGLDRQSMTTLFELFNPPTAYSQSVQVLGPIFENMARSSTSATKLVSPGLVIGILIAWTFVPLVLGNWRFGNIEID